MRLREIMFVRLHRPRARQRGADEAQPDRLELARRQLRARIARPEAVAVAGDDGETGDLLLPPPIVELGAPAVGGGANAHGAHPPRAPPPRPPPPTPRPGLA